MHDDNACSCRKSYMMTRMHLSHIVHGPHSLTIYRQRTELLWQSHGQMTRWERLFKWLVLEINIYEGSYNGRNRTILFVRFEAITVTECYVFFSGDQAVWEWFCNPKVSETVSSSIMRHINPDHPKRHYCILFVLSKRTPYWHQQIYNSCFRYLILTKSVRTQKARQLNRYLLYCFIHLSDNKFIFE
jgi:hypothetical protein